MKALHAIVLTALFSLPGCLLAQQYVISTFAGGGFPPTPATATNFTIGSPLDLTTDAAGNVYFASLNCAFSLDPNGILTRLAGTGAGGYSGDGASALIAKLFAPSGVAIDGSGNLYIADTTNARIRRVTASGAISTVAGNGIPGFSGEGGPAVNAELNEPTAVALDGAGNLYIFDQANLRIRKVSTSGIITTVAGIGTPGYSGDGGPATAAQIAPGHGLAADTAGNLYFADPVNQRIRKVAVADGTITTIAGGTMGSTGDGGPAIQAQLNFPSDVALDTAGNIYIAETARVRVISPGGIINSVPGSTGPANDPFVSLISVTVDRSGNIYVADATSRIGKITPGGTISIVAGPAGVVNYPANEPATGAAFSGPTAVAADLQGNVLIADTGNSWIWRVSAAGTIAIAGASLKTAAVTVDSKGNYYAAAQNEVVEAAYGGSAPSAPLVVAGGGSATGDGGLATSAFLEAVGGLAVDPAGNLYIADIGDNRIRKVTPAGIISTVAGTGTGGFSGDNGPAANAQLSSPRGIAFDSNGNLYIADSRNLRIRKVSATGVITTVAGGGTASVSSTSPVPTGDGGLATSAILDLPTGVAVDASGNIYIADSGFARVRKVTANGIINTIAGNGTLGYYGDGGLATAAAMYQPSGVAVDSAGNVYVAEQANNIVRMLQPTNAPVLVSAVLDAANERATAVTPGKIVVIYGSGLGPASTTLNAPANSAFGAQVAGTSVTFNGVAAPMIYASATQLSAIVPYEMAGAATAQVVVTSQSGVSTAFTVAVAASSPSFFSNNGSGAGQIAAVNLSGVVNDAANPVPVGGYISLYATGEGQTFPAGVDGALAMSVYPKPLLNVTMSVGGVPVTPVYAGAAPTEVLGLMQIVIQIPPGVQPGGYVPVNLQIGNSSTVSGTAWIAVSAN